MDNQLPNLGDEENKKYTESVRSLNESYSKQKALNSDIQSIFSSIASRDGASISLGKSKTENNNSVFISVNLKSSPYHWRNVAAEIELNMFNLKHYAPTGLIISSRLLVQSNGEIKFKQGYDAISYIKAEPIEALKTVKCAIEAMISISGYATSKSDSPVDLLRKIREFKPIAEKIAEQEKIVDEWCKVNSLRHAAKLRAEFMSIFDKPTDKLINELLNTDSTVIPVITGSYSDGQMHFTIDQLKIHQYISAGNKKLLSISDMNGRNKNISKADLKDRLKRDLLVIDSKAVQEITDIIPHYTDFTQSTDFSYLKMIEVAKAIKSRNKLHSA